MLLNLFTPLMISQVISYIRLALITILCLSLSELIAQEVNKSQHVAGQLYDRLEKAKKDYEEALSIGDSLKVAKACHELGKRYCALGKFDIGQKWFIHSLRIREPYGPSKEIGMTYIFMNDYFLHQEKYFEAIQNMEKAMANFKAANSQHGLMSGYLALASTYRLGFFLGYDKIKIHPKVAFNNAIKCYQQAEKIALSLKESSDIANVYLSWGMLFVTVEPKQTIYYLKKTKDILSKQGYKPTPLLLHTLLGLSVANVNSKNTEEAKFWLKKVEFVIDTSSHYTYQEKIDLTKTYTLLYEQTGDYKKALEYYKKHFEVAFEAINADREGAVSRLRLEYETEKKENQLKEQKRIINFVVGIGIFIFLVTLILYFFFKKYKQLSKENAALVAEQNHRVKNNLQQVTNLISLQSTRLKDDEAKRAMNEALLRIEAMALVHQRLYDSERLIEINLSTYIPKLTTGILRSYNLIKFTPVYELDDLWLHVDQAIPLGLILNELVTNACKYAFVDNPSPELSMECRIAEGIVSFRVIDNGPGFDTSIQHKTFGLKLIQIFSERLKGEYNFGNQGRIFQLSFKKKVSEHKKKQA